MQNWLQYDGVAADSEQYYADMEEKEHTDSGLEAKVLGLEHELERLATVRISGLYVQSDATE